MLLQNAVKRKVGGEAVGAVLSIGRGAYFSKRKKKCYAVKCFIVNMVRGCCLVVYRGLQF